MQERYLETELASALCLDGEWQVTIRLHRPLAKVAHIVRSLREETDDLRTSANFEARSLQAILRRSSRHLFSNGVRSRAKATGETQTRSSCQTELRRPSAADVAKRCESTAPTFTLPKAGI